MHIRTIIMHALEHLDVVGYWVLGIVIAAAVLWFL